jgi:hypothetical protein
VGFPAAIREALTYKQQLQRSRITRLIRRALSEG